ncbi:hypothetical protein DFH08DRAFT_825795 [Mycena albidolilacea]|uniref:Uncharacterized protein n=1 Tax=Mycena albidolilacea TaxID=1033008 RepID=A0AAD7E9I8_9AGAR|nr:hypothetical protein DFH08DRAFT_825795 [Mycena albidolilacea]
MDQSETVTVYRIPQESVVGKLGEHEKCCPRGLRGHPTRSLKALLKERNQQIAELRAALDAAHVQLLDAVRQIGTIADFQAATAVAEAACRATVERLKGFLQGVVTDKALALDIRNEVIGKKLGPENTLVAKDSVAAEDKHVTESDSDGKTEDDNSGGSTVYSEPESDPTTFLTPVPLVFIAQISPESCFLMPDGNWKGPMEYAQSFTNVKLNCLTVVPSQTLVYVNNFTNIVGNIQWFMAQSETAGYSKQGIFNASETQKRSIKLCCVLFQVGTLVLLCSSSTNEALINSETKEDIESIEKWPIDNENTRKAATELKKNHHIIPLPTCDIHGNLIHPTQYQDTLKDAVVWFTVLLKHWSITVKDNTREAHPRNNAASETKMYLYYRIAMLILEFGISHSLHSESVSVAEAEVEAAHNTTQESEGEAS